MSEPTLSFAGYQWIVRDYPGNPGPDNWSQSNAFVDAAGDLHLKVTYQNGQWTAAEIISAQSFGFGTYKITLASSVSGLDKSAVLGLFNYHSQDSQPWGTNEIDVEVTNGGATKGVNGYDTVWPSALHTVNPVDGNAIHTFNIPNDPHGDTFTYDWTGAGVSYAASTPAGMYDAWHFTPKQTAMVPQEEMPFHMNLWLIDGKPPTNGQSIDVVVSGFEFTPEPAPLIGVHVACHHHHGMIK